MDGGLRIIRVRTWGFPDTLVDAGMSGLVMVYSRSSDVHSGGASISCASHQIYVVWGWGTNIALPREYHGESDVPCCVTASMGIFGGEIEKY